MANRSSDTTSSSGSDSMFVKDPESSELATPLSPPKTTMPAPAASSSSPATNSTVAGVAQVSRWSHSTNSDSADGATGNRLSTNTTGSGDSSQTDPGRWSEGTFGDPVQTATAVSFTTGVTPVAHNVVSNQSLASLEKNISENQGEVAMQIMKSSAESYKSRRRQTEKEDDGDNNS